MADVNRVQIGLFRQLFLGHPAFLAEPADILANSFVRLKCGHWRLQKQVLDEHSISYGLIKLSGLVYACLLTGKGVGSQKTDGEPANYKIMADKDKKPSLLETIAFLVVVFIVAAALYKLFTEFWKWATTNRRRARICLPILFWIPLFGLVRPTIVLFLMTTGMAEYSDEHSLISDQQLLVNWSAAIFALIISLIITRTVARKIPEETISPEPPTASIIPQKEKSGETPGETRHGIQKIGTRGLFGCALCVLGIIRLLAANDLAEDALERNIGTGILDIVSGLLCVVWGYRKYGAKKS